MRNNLITVIGAATLAAGFSLCNLQANAALPPVWSVSIAGRPIDAQGEYALYRNGVIDVDLVDFARALGGTLIYRTPGGAEIAINNKHLVFTTGVKTALLDSIPVVLPAAPFVRGTRYYVPLRTLALTAGFHVHYDRAHAQISLGLPTIAVSPTPLASQLVLAAAGSPASDGLHLTATVANLTGAPLNVAFPTSARVAFVASRNGHVLWDSIGSVRALETKSSLMFAGNEAKSFAGFWPGFLTVGPGPIIVRAELLSTPPLFAPNFNVVGPPLPTPSPTPATKSSPPETATTAPQASPTPMRSTIPIATPSASPTALPTMEPTESPTPVPSPTPTASPTPHHHHHHSL